MISEFVQYIDMPHVLPHHEYHVLDSSYDGKTDISYYVIYNCSKEDFSVYGVQLYHNRWYSMNVQDVMECGFLLSFKEANKMFPGHHLPEKDYFIPHY